MNPLITILRHTQCRSTHHHFALDALPLVGTDAGKRLTKILLRYHDDYLRGAKDPDTRFRDFQNHVVHVKDGYWGGAPRVAHQWYDRMQRYLRKGKLHYAAHSAGVVSHYFSDPMMPLHTQQCDREKILHRPIEWSVTKSYSSIYKIWRDDEMRVVFDLSDKPGWLGEAILHGARYASDYYHPLMDTYDLARGKKNPTLGLSLISKQALAELFGLVVTGWARVLERAAADAEATMMHSLPTVSTTKAAALAIGRAPTKYLVSRLSNYQERLAVEALIEEYERTGELVRHLPVEVDIVHRVNKVWADENAWKARREQLRSSQTKVDVETSESMTDETDPEPRTIPFPQTTSQPRTRNRPLPTIRLFVTDPLVDAPSIGPRTAERFLSIGVHSVGQFLSASADDLSDQLATRWINSSIIELWQRQARVMCDVPGLNALAAQMLAGAGITDRSTLSNCDSTELHAKVSDYATTSAGRRYLRGSMPPKLSEVQKWIDDAHEERPAFRKSA
ncbi:hypothetical protein Pla22_13410 [Rubripirellula amarantea]|uniref:DUF4332 domain-containing protein n=1 Tax=Rubripirellula amarantea TaxID=2527999 RepID=A0A5C5WU22_9BACT|nr:DUF4332 domain-containing protein [Rubripirellula amarantea]TWT53709.1 hypothetical protein Pla22_13410 [Rubripirellula amarantea]